MGFQWIAGIVFALWVSPLAWYGAVSRTHIHVWAAVVVGGIISLFPALLGLLRPGPPVDALHHRRRADADGRAAHPPDRRTPRNALPRLRLARVSRVLSRLARPDSGHHRRRRSTTCCAGCSGRSRSTASLVASQWRWVEHAAWVIFEDVFLVVSCLRSVAEMRETAERTATARAGDPHPPAGGNRRAQRVGAQRRHSGRGARLRHADGRIGPHRAIQSRGGAHVRLRRRGGGRHAARCVDRSRRSSSDLTVRALRATWRAARPRC